MGLENLNNRFDELHSAALSKNEQLNQSLDEVKKLSEKTTDLMKLLEKVETKDFTSKSNEIINLLKKFDHKDNISSNKPADNPQITNILKTLQRLENKKSTSPTTNFDDKQLQEQVKNLGNVVESLNKHSFMAMKNLHNDVISLKRDYATLTLNVNRTIKNFEQLMRWVAGESTEFVMDSPQVTSQDVKENAATQADIDENRISVEDILNDDKLADAVINESNESSEISTATNTQMSEYISQDTEINSTNSDNEVVSSVPMEDIAVSEENTSASSYNEEIANNVATSETEPDYSNEPVEHPEYEAENPYGTPATNKLAEKMPDIEPPVDMTIYESDTPFASSENDVPASEMPDLPPPTDPRLFEAENPYGTGDNVISETPVAQNSLSADNPYGDSPETDDISNPKNLAAIFNDKFAADMAELDILKEDNESFSSEDGGKQNFEDIDITSLLEDNKE